MVNNGAKEALYLSVIKYLMAFLMDKVKLTISKKKQHIFLDSVPNIHIFFFDKHFALYPFDNRWVS